MDFYKNKKRLKIVKYICLVGSLALLLVNCLNSYLGAEMNYLGIISNVFLIIAMTISIRQEKKMGEKDIS